MLTKEQIQFYEDNGYIKLSNIFSENEIDEISEEYDALFARKNNADLHAVWKGEEMEKACNNDNNVVRTYILPFINKIYNILALTTFFSSLPEYSEGT